MRWWIKLLAAAMAILLLLWLGWSLVNGFMGILNGAELNASKPDPMFAQEAELPTRPPELDAEEAPADHPTLDDYVPEVFTPVDKTIDELIEEAKQKSEA